MAGTKISNIIGTKISNFGQLAKIVRERQSGQVLVVGRYLVCLLYWYKVQILTQLELYDGQAALVLVVHKYLLYWYKSRHLLYWYKSTNTDAGRAV